MQCGKFNSHTEAVEYFSSSRAIDQHNEFSVFGRQIKHLNENEVNEYPIGIFIGLLPLWMNSKPFLAPLLANINRFRSICFVLLLFWFDVDKVLLSSMNFCAYNIIRVFFFFFLQQNHVKKGVYNSFCEIRNSLLQSGSNIKRCFAFEFTYLEIHKQSLEMWNSREFMQIWY